MSTLYAALCDLSRAYKERERAAEIARVLRMLAAMGIAA